jgi:hypothetical protein
MNNIIDPPRRRPATWLGASGGYGRVAIRLAVAFVVVAAIPAMAQGWESRRAVIIASANLRPYSAYPHGSRQLDRGDVARILRDWGLRVLSGPFRSATEYEAIVKDDAGQSLFVKVDPRDGAILSLDPTDKVGTGLFSFAPSGGAQERPGGDSVQPSTEPREPPRSLSRVRHKAQPAARPIPRLARRREEVEERKPSKRVATVEPPVEPSVAKQVVVAPSASHVKRRTAKIRHGKTAPASAARPAPATARPDDRVIRNASPSPAAGERIASPGPPSPVSPPVAASPKEEAPSTPRKLPADAGFD